MKKLLDGEVLGIDNDGGLICWDAVREERYNCGQTLKQYGMKNLTDREKRRLKLQKKGA